MTTGKEKIEKAIRHFECVKNDAVAVLDRGFGTHKGENDLVYRNKKMYAELAIAALKKQMPKKPVKDKYHHNCCPNCGWIVSYDEGWGEKYVPYCENCGQAIDLGV